jgi:hypothetical protein
MIIPQISFAQAGFFRVIEEAPSSSFGIFDFYKYKNSMPARVPKGTVVKSNSQMEIINYSIPVNYSVLMNINIDIPYVDIIVDLNDILPGIAYPGSEEQWKITANYLHPLKTEDLFEEYMLYCSERQLVSSFYVNALQSLDREIIYYNNSQLWDTMIKYAGMKGWYDEDEEYDIPQWWERAAAKSNLVITQIGLSFSNEYLKSDLQIRNIKKNGDEYRVTVREVYNKDWHDMKISWGNYELWQEFDVILALEGDYLDVYFVDSYGSTVLAGTYAFVNSAFIKQLNALIKGDPVDLTGIIWPDRGNGHLKYPPSASEFSPTHRALGNLRLRDAGFEIANVIITLPKDTEVQLINRSESRYNENWMLVISSNGYTGWCFEGDLEDLNGTVKTGADTYRVNRKNSPVKIWFLIIGVAAAAGGAAVLLAIVKKK